MKSDNWQNKTLICSFIAIESLLLVISVSKPAFSSYFAVSRPYKNNLKQIQFSSNLQANNRHLNRAIKTTEIKSFTGNVFDHENPTGKVISLLDSIGFKKNLEFAQFKDDLATNSLDFFSFMGKNNLNPWINSIYSYWQDNLEEELENFLHDRNTMAGINSENIGVEQVTRNPLWEVDSLIIMLILGVILFRVNQQIQNKPPLNQESQELHLSKTHPSKNQLFK